MTSRRPQQRSASRWRRGNAERGDTARLEAFSDGVLAIAITLLILDVRVDQAPEQSLVADARTAMLLYGGTLTACAVAFNIIWRHARRPASSGRTTRHRLNRSGNRTLNRVLCTIAITQIRADTEGRAYYLRKRAEGKTSQSAALPETTTLRRRPQDPARRPHGSSATGTDRRYRTGTVSAAAAKRDASLRPKPAAR